MSEMSYLWTAPSEAGDGAAPYTRADWARIAEILAACSGSEGVAPGYLNELEVTQAGANTVEVNAGGAVVDGKPYLNGVSEAINIPSAVGAGTTRIDLIVARADWTAQTVRITRVAGVDAANPTPPAPANNRGDVFDVVLAQVTVNTSGNVTVDESVKQWAAVDEAAWRCLTPGQRALLQRAYAAIETFRNPDASDDEALDAAFLVLDLPQVLLDEAARVRQQSE